MTEVRLTTVQKVVVTLNPIRAEDGKPAEIAGKVVWTAQGEFTPATSVPAPSADGLQATITAGTQPGVTDIWISANYKGGGGNVVDAVRVIVTQSVNDLGVVVGTPVPK